VQQRVRVAPVALFGAEILLKEAPVTFGVEIGPGLAFGPNVWGFIIDGLITLRFLL